MNSAVYGKKKIENVSNIIDIILASNEKEMDIKTKLYVTYNNI